jgi:hypothetical protein
MIRGTATPNCDARLIVSLDVMAEHVAIALTALHRVRSMTWPALGVDV